MKKRRVYVSRLGAGSGCLFQDITRNILFDDLTRQVSQPTSLQRAGCQDHKRQQISPSRDPRTHSLRTTGCHRQILEGLALR